LFDEDKRGPEATPFRVLAAWLLDTNVLVRFGSLNDDPEQADAGSA